MKSKKVFIFGKFYKLVDSENPIPKVEINKKQIQAEYEKKSAYEVNKMNYILESFVNEKSMVVNYDKYEGYIMEDEKIKGKDLYNYTADEIQDLMSTIFTTSRNVKANIYSFIKLYLSWAKDKGYCQYNITDLLSDEEMLKVNPKMLKKVLYSRKEIDSICEKMLLQDVPVFRMLPLILARYGIIGDSMYHMINLKWEDIDKKKMCVNIEETKGDKVKKMCIPIDNLFLKWIDKAYTENSFKENLVIDYGYVIKKSGRKGENEKANFNTIYGQLEKSLKEINMGKITFNDLLKSRMMDLLLDMREKRKLTTSNVLSVVRLFKPYTSGGGYVSMQKNWDTLTGDMVLKIQKVKPDMLEDKDSEKLVARLRSELFGE